MVPRQRKRLDPRDLSRRRAWVYFAVAVFLIVDIALVVLALNSAHPGTPRDTLRPIPTFTAQAPSPSPAQSATTSARAVPSTRVLAAFDGTTAWRATTGACPATPASPELTTDSGATWKKTDATGPTKVTAIQRIFVGGKDLAMMVGLNQADCTPALIKTFVAGRSYAAYPKELAGTWFVNPADRSSVHSPAGVFASPCSVIALAPRDAKTAAVLCDDHTVHMTTDAAATWLIRVDAPGAVALAASDTGYFAAALDQVGCAGVQVTGVNTNATSNPGCYPIDAAADSLAAKVAVSAAGGTLWLWAGDSVARSTDNGATWR
jgi:hypothetical protein